MPFKRFNHQYVFNFRSYIIVLITATLLFSACGSKVKAQLTTSKIFGDHMVLQRNRDVAIWGWGNPGSSVTVSFNKQQVSGKVEADGSWKIILKPMIAGGPYTMHIASGGNNIDYQDVMMGEVWLCSGQSNMQFFLINASGYKQELDSAAHLQVRQFTVPQAMSLKPAQNLSGGKWINSAPGTIGYFSAVAYFLAKNLSAKLHVTVGIVNSSWGSSQAECWISKDAMLKSNVLSKVAANQPDNWQTIKNNINKEVRDYAYNKQKVELYKAESLAAKEPSFFKSWKTGSIGAWQWQDSLIAYRGTGFMQRTVNVDARLAGQASALSLGQTDAEMAIYINGNSVFKGALPKGQPINLPAGTWKTGANSLLINLLSDQKDPSWFGFGINGDVNDTYFKIGGSTIKLADYEWRLMPDFSKPYHIEPSPNNTVFTVYNSMIAPLTSLSVAGVVWYQGEANSQRAQQYRSVLPLLITDWRSKWKTDLPFIITQLPAFGPPSNSNQGSAWAELREAQASALALRNTNLAVTYDLGDPFNIHPVNKRPVGNRLAYAALYSAYHLPGYFGATLFKSVEFDNGTALVNLNNPAANQLVVKPGTGELKGFEIAGADHLFYPAQATIVQNQVKVWSDNVKQPVAVRYAWSNSPLDANLFTQDGLPVSPFRTDHFPDVTANRTL